MSTRTAKGSPRSTQGARTRSGRGSTASIQAFRAATSGARRCYRTWPEATDDNAYPDDDAFDRADLDAVPGVWYWTPRVNSDGDRYMTGYTRQLPLDDCENCKARTCIQRVIVVEDSCGYGVIHEPPSEFS